MENAFHFPPREREGTAMTQADTCSTCSSELCDLGCAVETNIPPLKDWLDLVTCVLHEEDTAEGKVDEGKVCDV